MLYIGKAVHAVTGDVLEWKIDASNATTAGIKLREIVMESYPMICLLFNTWVEPAEDQPEDARTYAVFCYDHATGMRQNNYPDTWEDAVDFADAMSNFYDEVEICYGWPGHWQHVDKDDVGLKLWCKYHEQPFYDNETFSYIPAEKL